MELRRQVNIVQESVANDEIGEAIGNFFSGNFLKGLENVVKLGNVAPLLTYFHQFLQEGDYLVVEDCNPNVPTVSGMGSVYEEYVPWGRDKLDQLRSFLTEHKCWYSVDSFYTDFFGYNNYGTCNWHGIIRKMMWTVYD